MIKAVDVEEVVLGSILCDSTVNIIVSSEAFTGIRKDVFNIIEELKKENTPIDLITVGERVQNKTYLINLVNKISTTANIEYHQRILIQYQVQRQIEKDCEYMLINNGDIFDSIDRLKNNISYIESLIR